MMTRDVVFERQDQLQTTGAIVMTGEKHPPRTEEAVTKTTVRAVEVVAVTIHGTTLIPGKHRDNSDNHNHNGDETMITAFMTSMTMTTEVPPGIDLRINLRGGRDTMAALTMTMVGVLPVIVRGGFRVAAVAVEVVEEAAEVVGVEAVVAIVIGEGEASNKTAVVAVVIVIGEGEASNKIVVAAETKRAITHRRRCALST